MDENKVSNLHDSKLWPNVKPFLEGGLAGAIMHIPSQMALKSLDKFCKRLLLNDFHNQYLFNIAVKQMPSSLVMTTLQSTMLFGTFGFLTRKVEAANEGMPLTLSEFWLWFVRWSCRAIVTAPFYMSIIRLYQSANLTRTSIIQDLYGKAANEGILALWKGGVFTGTGLWLSNVGMLAMYNPCYDYLRESVGLTANSSVLGAGLMSGFFASTCSYPYMHVHKAMINMKPGISGKYQFTGYLDCALKILKFGGPFAFYRGSRPHILRVTTHLTVLWYCLEKVKKTGESFGW